MPARKVGWLNKRVIIKLPTITPGTMGQHTESLATVATVWASIQPTKPDEKFDFHQVFGKVTHTITIRHIDSVTLTTKHLITYGAREFDIKGIIDERERNKYLVITALERNV